MALPGFRKLFAGLSQRRPPFFPGSVHVEFVVEKVAPEQVLLRVRLFSPANVIPQCFYILLGLYHLGDKQSVGGPSSELIASLNRHEYEQHDQAPGLFRL
jgi:hypothetical protein